MTRLAALFFALLLLTAVRFAGQFRTVKRVVDGDTLVLENGERVRLIGIGYAGVGGSAAAGAAFRERGRGVHKTHGCRQTCTARV